LNYSKQDVELEFELKLQEVELKKKTKIFLPIQERVAYTM